MSNKTLEQQIELESHKSDGALEYPTGFKAGAQFVLDNLSLLNPSDVAKIECVSELLKAVATVRATYGNDSNGIHQLMYDQLSNFEPKKEGAE